jgi:S-DNA-T family DNA segregation ATPase FtsK/SpoIIIE
MFDSDEPVALIFEAAVRLVGLAAWSVFRLARFAVRRPVRALAIVGLVLLDRYAGHVAVLLLLACLGAGLFSWSLASPDSYRRMVRPRLNELWLSLIYPRKWRRVAHRVGLVAHDFDNDRSRRYVCGALHKVKVTPAGIVRLHVAIPVGLTLDDYARRADALAVAFGAREARVSAAGTTSVWVELHRSDVLASTIRPLPLESAPDLNLAAVPIGRHEDGTLWRFSLWQTHVLIAGATGAGKGSILWSLLHGLSPAINAGWVQVWAIDPKGGMELRPGVRLFSRFEDGTPETMCDLLEDLVSVMDARAKRLAARGIRKHQPSPESPHVLAVIDELATLTAFAERSVVRRIEQALGLLLTKGRAVGITVLAAVQDPGKDVVGWRDLFPTRVAMRLDNPIQVDMVLGEGARDLGATADHISEHTPGVAFVRVEGSRAMRRVRASYLTDDDIAGLASSVTASPALSAPRPPKPVDALDDLMAEPVPRPTSVPDPKPDAKSTNENPAPGPARKPRKPRKHRKPEGSQVA